MRSVIIGAVGLVVMGAVPMAVWAQETPEVEVLRQWSVPLSLSPFSAQFSVGQGEDVWMMGRDDGDDPVCAIVVMAQEGVLWLDVELEFGSTRCLAVEPLDGEEGEFLLRGERKPSGQEDWVGFMALVDGSGEVMWRVDDSEWVEGRMSADYEGPTPVIAAIDGGEDGAPVVWSAVEVSVSRSGVTHMETRMVGFDGATGEVIGDWTGERWPGEEELVQLERVGNEFWGRGQQGEVAHGMDGRWEMVLDTGGSWDERRVVDLAVEAETEQVWALWSDLEALEAGIAAIGGEDVEELSRWETQGGGMWFGEPRWMEVGEEGFAIEHRPPGQDGHLRWSERGSSGEGYFVEWRRLTEEEPVYVIFAGERWLVLSVDASTATLREYSIDLVSGPTDRSTSWGCYSVSRPGHSPIGWWIVILGGLVFLRRIWAAPLET